MSEPTKVTFDVHYYHAGRTGPKGTLSHSYTETWSETKQFCPECGAQKVWVEDGIGDYYHGNLCMCLACGAVGSMWDGVVMAPYDRFTGQPTPNEQRLRAIRGRK